ncbi:MAG TPA: HipA family kinase, partial [Chitinophagaceae bacterium]|nr:HipA family kinase [Chitinophagaceae bacterium]
MIESIPYIRAISIRRKLNTVGSEPLHLIGDDYNAYYVKNNQRLFPASVLINEVVCHFLLKAWGINTPDIALIEIEKETLNQNYGTRHRKLYYERLAFGSKEVEAAFDLTELATIKGKVDFKKFYRPEMFARIGLFDMWVENEDRPPDLKNIMLFEVDERYHFLAIDNAMAFRTGAYETLTDNEFYPSESNYCLQSAFFKRFRRYLRAERE